MSVRTHLTELIHSLLLSKDPKALEQLESLSLEVYHMPRWFLGIGKQQAPWLKHLMDEKALKAAAERRAAKLRSRLIRVGDVPGDVEEARMPLDLGLPLPITSALA